MNENTYQQADDEFEEAENYFFAGEYEKATTLYRRVITCNPNFSFSYYRLAQIHLLSKRLKESLQIIDNCMEKDPGFEGLYFLKAKILARKGEDALALRILDRGKNIIQKKKLAELYKTYLQNRIK